MRSIARAEHGIILGGQRCGSTLLLGLLAQHPDVSVQDPVSPEPRYFLEDPIEDPARYREQVFPGARGPFFVEKSTTYLERPEVIEPMLRTLPDVRLIAILRDPIDRAVSNYHFSRHHAFEDLPIDRALTAEAEERTIPGADHLSTPPNRYLQRSRYELLLAPFLERFGSDRVHLLTLEGLIADPVGALSELQAALGLDPAPLAIEPMDRVNASPRGAELAERTRARLRRELAPTYSAIIGHPGLDTSGWCR